jgi:hypothetical protein
MFDCDIMMQFGTCLLADLLDDGRPRPFVSGAGLVHLEPLQVHLHLVALSYIQLTVTAQTQYIPVIVTLLGLSSHRPDIRTRLYLPRRDHSGTSVVCRGWLEASYSYRITVIVTTYGLVQLLIPTTMTLCYVKTPLFSIRSVHVTLDLPILNFPSRTTHNTTVHWSCPSTASRVAYCLGSNIGIKAFLRARM